MLVFRYAHVANGMHFYIIKWVTVLLHGARFSRLLKPCVRCDCRNGATTKVRSEGGQGGTIPRCRVTGRGEMSQKRRKYFLQYGAFAPKGRQTCFLALAPSDSGAPLRPPERDAMKLQCFLFIKKCTISHHKKLSRFSAIPITCNRWSKYHHSISAQHRGFAEIISA